MRRLLEATRQNRPNLRILHLNATIIRKFFAKIALRAPYSPYMSPWDFFPFTRLKDHFEAPGSTQLKENK